MLSNCGAREDFESPLDNKEIKPVNPRGNQPWTYIGRIDAKAETPILWPPNVKRWFVGKDSDSGKDWEQEAKGLTEDEMVGCHHQLNGHEFEQTSGDNEGQVRLVCAAVHGVERVICDWIITIWKNKKKLTQQGRIGQEFCCSLHDHDAESWSKREPRVVLLHFFIPFYLQQLSNFSVFLVEKKKKKKTQEEFLKHVTLVHFLLFSLRPIPISMLTLSHYKNTLSRSPVISTLQKPITNVISS